MVHLECPSRQGSARSLCMIMVCIVAAHSLEAAPCVQVSFSTSSSGSAAVYTAVSIDDESSLVSVIAAGANPTHSQILGNESTALEMVGFDPVSRLVFLKADQACVSGNSWALEIGESLNSSLQSLEPSGSNPCQSVGWVKQVGGRILPFALVRIQFPKGVPAPGTPLANRSGQIVAILFQGWDKNMGFAIPAETVWRVRQDLSKGGKLSRGWLGLALRAETTRPIISRVLPDSPSAKAGIQQGDVLISIGSRQISDYADAANAFFYLVRGQQVQVKLKRGDLLLDLNLTPLAPRP